MVYVGVSSQLNALGQSQQLLHKAFCLMHKCTSDGFDSARLTGLSRMTPPPPFTVVAPLASSALLPAVLTAPCAGDVELTANGFWFVAAGLGEAEEVKGF